MVGRGWNRKMGAVQFGIILILVCCNGVLHFPEEDIVEGTKITVDKSEVADYNTIQAAIENASNGDEIHIGSGTYYEQVIINKSISLWGSGINHTIILNTGAWGGAVIIDADNVTISNLTVTQPDELPNSRNSLGINILNVKDIRISNVNCSGFHTPERQILLVPLHAGRCNF